MINTNFNIHEFIPKNLINFSLFKNNIEKYPYVVALQEILGYYKVSYKSFNKILNGFKKNKWKDFRTLSIYFNDDIKIISRLELSNKAFKDIENDWTIDIENLTNKEKEQYLYYDDLFIFFKSESIMIKVLTKIEDLAEQFQDLETDEYLNFTKYFYVKWELINDEQEIYFSDLEKIKKELYPQLNVDTLINYFKQSEENLLLLNWEPWVWKTSFVKYFFSQLEHADDIIYTSDIEVLKDDYFWSKLLKNNVDLLVIDDIDDVIKRRDEKWWNIVVNKLLTILDWIIRNNIKVIITTNLDSNEIDPAILRSWRCFESIKLEPLNINEAKKIWKSWGYDLKILDKEITSKKLDKVSQSKLIEMKKNIENNIIKAKIYNIK